MDQLVQSYLAAHPFHHETIDRWPIQGNLRERLCLASTLPPSHVSSSILAIVLNANDQVLYLCPDTPSGSIRQLLIGGRPEGNETPHQTAIREVAEETGWRIDPIRMIGFRHFFHLEPHRPESDRPYPDFIQPIFAARAIEFAPERLIPADHIPSRFIDLSTAEATIDPPQRPLLHAAVSALS